MLLLACILSQANGSGSANWKAKAEASGLDGRAIKQLERDGILVAGEAYRQAFSAYTSGKKNPVFITSDSLLNAYHTLYEESIVRLEVANAKRLPPFLREVISALDGCGGDDIKCAPELKAAALQRAKLVLGIAVRLQDDGFRFGDPTLDAILEDEVARINNAEGRRMPAWLGEPSPSFMGIDYNRYKPRGFYAKRENLARYFRTHSWLQSIPFRINNDVEMLAILMVGNCAWRMDAMPPVNYRQFLGQADNLDFSDAATGSFPFRIEIPGDGFGKLRREFIEKAKKTGKGRINDMEPSFRILSAYQTPSALLFTQTTAPQTPRRPLPNGLEVPAAMGSGFAAGLLDPSLLPTIERVKGDFAHHPYPTSTHQPRMRGLSLYKTYLHVLEALINPPEPDAPDFMRGDAWQIKSLNTFLGSWSQMRHTWVLQAKQSILWTCATSEPVGFVEPEPDFFARMANLAEATKLLLQQHGAFTPDYVGTAEAILQLTTQYGNLENRDAFEDIFHELPTSEQADLLPMYVLLDCSPSEAKYGSGAHYRESVAWMRRLAEDIRSGNIDKESFVVRLAEEQGALETKWDKLGRISARLDSLAQKQLRGVAFNEMDNVFIADYGKNLAELCFYHGNSYLNPRDDAPKLADVFSNINEGQHLHVGIARPRKMYVLYPWQGKDVLCEGAVLPYYEFAHPTRLNDAEWKGMLDSRKRPPVPGWFQPVVDGGKLGKPEFE